MSVIRNTSNFNSDDLTFESNPDQTGPLASEGEDAQAVVSGTNGGPEGGDLAADGANSGANGSEVRILAADSSRANGRTFHGGNVGGSGSPTDESGKLKMAENEGIIGSKLTDEQILERLEITSDMLPFVTEDELTQLADGEKYASFAIELFVKTRLRFMLRAAMAEEKGPPGHKEKLSEKENDQGKRVSFDRPDLIIVM